MKKLITAIGTLVLSALAALPSAAQPPDYVAEIPFDFRVGGTDFKAGSYSILTMSVGGNAGPIVLRSRDGSTQRLMSNYFPGSRKRSSVGKITFVSVAGVYTLRDVITPSFEVKLTVERPNRGGRLASNPDTKTVTARKQQR